MSIMNPVPLIFALGSTIGLVLSAYRDRQRDPVEVIDQGLLALSGALVGARFGYVVINWEYFQSHFQETWQVWLGGFSGLGAVYGFVFFICLGGLWGKGHLDALADGLLPLGMTLLISGWLAVWVDGSAYGPQDTSWFSLPAKDQTGTWSQRWPVQFLGALLSLALWAVLGWVRHIGTVTGRTAALGLAGAGVILFSLSFLRADPIPVINGLRMDTWAALGLTLLGFAGWLVSIRTKSRGPKR